MNWSVLAVGLVASALAACGSSGRQGGRPTTSPPAITPSPSACAPPVLPDGVRAAVEKELATPVTRSAAGFRSTPTISKVRRVQVVAPGDAPGSELTAVVVDVTAGTGTLTVGFPVTVTDGFAEVGDWSGLLVPEEVGTKAVSLKVGRGYFLVGIHLTYGVTSSSLASSVTQTITQEGGQTEEFTAVVCDGVFVIGGRPTLPNGPVTRNRIQLSGPGGVSLLTVDLNVEPVD